MEVNQTIPTTAANNGGVSRCASMLGRTHPRLAVVLRTVCVVNKQMEIC